MGNGARPLCDVLSFEINNENDVLLIVLIFTKLLTLRKTQSVEG